MEYKVLNQTLFPVSFCIDATLGATSTQASMNICWRNTTQLLKLHIKHFDLHEGSHHYLFLSIILIEYTSQKFYFDRNIQVHMNKPYTTLDGRIAFTADWPFPG